MSPRADSPRGWFWGTIILLVEFVGGISVAVGFYTWVATALIGMVQ